MASVQAKKMLIVTERSEHAGLRPEKTTAFRSIGASTAIEVRCKFISLSTYKKKTDFSSFTRNDHSSSSWRKRSRQFGLDAKSPVECMFYTDELAAVGM